MDKLKSYPGYIYTMRKDNITFKRSLSLLFIGLLIIHGVLVFIPNDISADPVTNKSDFTYQQNSADVYITGYNGPGGVVSIPTKINNLPVTKIADYAFEYSNVLEITIPENVRIIGNYSFKSSYTLQKVILPSTLDYIGYRAFYLCTNLYEFNLPEGLTTIKEEAFAYCEHIGIMDTVIIPSTLSELDDKVFYNCSGMYNLIILDGITSIGYACFAECEALTEVYIPGSVATIEESAFYHSGLVNVIIGNHTGGNAIGDRAFEKCYYLIRVRMSQTVTTIGSNAFAYCLNLTDIAFNKGVTSIGSFALAYSGITTIYIQSLNAPTIGESWIEGCDAITTYVFPWSAITTISGTTVSKTLANYTYSGEYFLRYFGSSNTYTLPYHTTGTTVCRYISSYAFFGNTDITLIDFDGLTTYYVLGSYCFAYCTALTTVYIDNVLSQMGNYNFYYCAKLISVNFVPDGVVIETDIEDGTFQYCFALTTITLPSWVRIINTAAFYGCWNLVSVSFLGTVTQIQYAAFAECWSLEQINIPGTVATVGESAFFNCRSLWNVTLNSGITKIGSWAFEYCESLASIIIPNSVTEIDDYAFEFCKNLTYINLGTGITRLGYSVFHGCFALPYIYIPASVTTLGDNWLNMTAGVFDQCISLTNIQVDINNTKFASSGGCLYSKDMKTFIQCCGGKSGQFTVPNFVTTIMPGAFYYCTKLTWVTIPEGVTNVSYACFASCESLISVTLPSTLTEIEPLAFQLCPNLAYITIPDSVTIIGDNAFYFCHDLVDVTLGNHVQIIGELAFYACDSLKSIYIPDSVYLIDNYSFMYCLDLQVVRIGQGIAWIGQAAFMNCESLTDIYFYSATVPTIDILWLEGSNPLVVGHAFNDSDFPIPGTMLYTDFYFYEAVNYDAPTGLLMADYITIPIPPIIPGSPDEINIYVIAVSWLLVMFLPIVIFGMFGKFYGMVLGIGLMSVVFAFDDPSRIGILLIGVIGCVILLIRGRRDN